MLAAYSICNTYVGEEYKYKRVERLDLMRLQVL